MKRLTRRRFAALGGVGLAGVLAGCSSGSNGTDGPPAGGGGSDGNGGDEETTSATPTATTPTAEYPGFAADTAGVADGIVWHATRWNRTMSEVRVHANRVVGAVEDLQAADTITANDIAGLERETTDMASFLDERVVPHYVVPDDAVLNGNNVYVQQLKIASSRGDVEAQRTQLGRIASLYEKYGRSSFLENAFPNGPIHAKLNGHLAAGEATGAVFGVFHPASGFVETVTRDTLPNDQADDGVPQHVHEFPSGHVVVAHSHPRSGAHDLGEHENEPVTRRLYAYRNGQFDVLEDTNAEVPRLTDFEPELIDVFESVSVPDRRDDVVYVTVNDAGGDFVHLPLQIQQFDSRETAAATVEFLLSADVFQEGTTNVGGRSWRRIYYVQQETNVYAFLLRTGSYVVTVFPETVPWGERVDWPGPFAETWISETEG